MLKAKFSTRAHLHGKNTSISAQTPTPPNCPETPANPSKSLTQGCSSCKMQWKLDIHWLQLFVRERGEGGDTNSVSVCATRVAINLKDNAMVHIWFYHHAIPRSVTTICVIIISIINVVSLFPIAIIFTKTMFKKMFIFTLCVIVYAPVSSGRQRLTNW